MKHVLYWTPRTLGVLFGLYMSLFATDAFAGEAGLWTKLARFAIHLTPVAVYSVALILAWRWERVGAATFTALGVLYCLTAGRRHLDWSLFVAGPLFVMAAMFLGSWLAAREHA